MPGHSTPFYDFPGEHYFTKNPEGFVKFIVEPIWTVSLKEKYIADADQFENVFKIALKMPGI